ncbi:MAG: IS3 family transposase [Bacilli bacterium]|nr:IS3 family transposase [Bacilli bacterium]
MKLLLSVAHMAKSTYEYIMGHPDRGSDAGLEAAVEGIFLGSRRRYGYRRVTAELRKSRGSVNHKRVKRIMKELGLFARVPKARYSSYRGTVGKVAPNLLDRQFGAGRPYEKWVTDVTEFHLPWGKAYLSPVLDLFSRSVVGYDLSKSPSFSQTESMLRMSFAGKKDFGGMILHSDQGWQYQMAEYQSMLRERNIRQSMSRKGNCHDNSVMENFFGRLKTEMFYGHEYEFGSFDELKKAIDGYILWWNTKRIQRKLNWIAPHEVLSNWYASAV